MATWKDIQGFEGIYRISTSGEVLSLLTGNLKKPELAKNGYLRVNLFKNGKGCHKSIHRLVASAYIPNPERYEQVNHKDGNKLNNNAENLEWCTASHNMQHAYSNNLIHPKTTRVVQYSPNYQKIREWESIKEASDALGLNHANIVTVCTQKTNRKFAGGYIWRYANG